MVGHTQLKLRMSIVGSILFALYLAVAYVIFQNMGGGVVAIAVLSVGLLFYPLVLYRFGTYSAVKDVGAEEMPEQPQGRRRYDEIHRSTEQLCREMDLKKPRLMVAEMGVPNAFATGRRGNGIVVLSKEIIDLLDHDELEGVVAHELAHLDNRDTVTMVMGQSLAAVVGWMVYLYAVFRGEQSFIVGWIGSILAQLIVTLLLRTVSRYREYVADEDAATYTRNPEAMARALEKISSGSQGKEMRGEESVSALCIFGGGGISKLLATHPPTEKRISRLRSMSTGY